MDGDGDALEVEVVDADIGGEAAEEGDALAELELDVGFYEERAAEVGGRGKVTTEVAGRGRRERIRRRGVDGALDGGALEDLGGGPAPKPAIVSRKGCTVAGFQCFGEPSTRAM